MVEHQGEGEVTVGLGAPIRKLLEERDGRPTIVRMASGEEVLVYDIAWGRDIGDMWEHVTANCSPPVDGRPHHFFYLSEVESLWDSDTREMLLRQTPAPGET